MTDKSDPVRAPCNKFVYTPDGLDRLMCWTCGFRKDAHSPEACVEPISTGIIGRRRTVTPVASEPDLITEAALYADAFADMSIVCGDLEKAFGAGYRFAQKVAPVASEPLWINRKQLDRMLREPGTGITVYTERQASDDVALYAHPPVAPVASEPVALLQAIADAAHGLCFGEDWNKGTHAKVYRPKLMAAVKAYRTRPPVAPVASEPVAWMCWEGRTVELRFDKPKEFESFEKVLPLYFAAPVAPVTSEPQQAAIDAAEKHLSAFDGQKEPLCRADILNAFFTGMRFADKAVAPVASEPVALTPEALNTAATLLEGLMRAPRSVPMQWRTLEEQVLALAVSTLRQLAHPPANEEYGWEDGAPMLRPATARIAAVSEPVAPVASELEKAGSNRDN